MHSLILTLLAFAVMALASPMVNDKRDPETVDMVTVFTTTSMSVTATPPAWTPAEVETHHRHRHVSHVGSPLPHAEYGFSLLTAESLPVPTPTIASTVDSETSSVKTSQVGSFNIDTSVESRSTVVPTDIPSLAHPSVLRSFMSFITSFDTPVEPVSTVAPTDIPDFKTHSRVPNSFTSWITSSDRPVEFENTMPTAVSTHITDSETHLYVPSIFTSFIDSTASTTTIMMAPTQTRSFTSVGSSQATIVSTQTESSASSISTPVTIVPASSETASSSISDLNLQMFSSQIAPPVPTTFVPNLDTTSSTYKAIVLQHHNIHRRNHSAEDLAWDDKLAKDAEITAKTCNWGHSLAPGGGGYGQNIAAGYQSGNISAILTDWFYNGEMTKFNQYGIELPDQTNFEAWAHFTQMVWKETMSVGCYTAICSPPGSDPLKCKPDGKSYLKKLSCGNGGIPAIFTVCNYYPQGNIFGNFSNVGAPLGNKAVYVDNTGVHGL